MEDYRTTVELQPIICGNCTIAFAMPQLLYENRKRDHGAFFCPMGHSQYFPGKSDLEVERDARDAARAQADRLKLEVLSANQRAADARKETERIKKRAKNGVCPCCHRSFVALRRHMETKHPTFAVP
jgi:hypothetical protein